MYGAHLARPMSGLDEYTALLDKAHASLPENVGNRERWSLPPSDLIKEGRMTILRNFREIVNAVRRDEDHLAKYIFQQLGTAGQIDGDRLVLTGNVQFPQIQGRLDDYVATYVQCSECGSPDTKLVRQERVLMLQCEACGAHEPVKARKGVRRAEARGVRMGEGAVITVTIEKTGNKGQGMAEVEGYTVVVPKQEVGTTLKVKIVRVTGRIAAGQVVED